jgi:hypothetical protein
MGHALLVVESLAAILLFLAAGIALAHRLLRTIYSIHLPTRPRDVDRGAS